MNNLPSYHVTFADTPEARYLRDPNFRRLVDTIEHHITQCLFSPSEMREAVMLGCIHFETRRVHPGFISGRDL